MAAPRILALDNYDSFTFTLVDYLKSLGALVDVMRNDETTVEDVLAAGYQGIMISPGPGTPENAGISVDLARECIERAIPLLGICLGHQAMAVALGQQITRTSPMHGKIARVRHDGSGLFANLPSPLDATRYHSLAAADPKPPLVANAWSEDGVVMGMRHECAPAHGLQFHPESVASEHGHHLLGAFLGLCA